MGNIFDEMLIEGGALDLRADKDAEESYHLEVKCLNCGWSGTAILNKGQRKPTRPDCPHCGIPELMFGIDAQFKYRY